MSRAVAAPNVTAARSPETVSASTNIRRPGTGSVTSKSISFRQGSWSSARGRLRDGHDGRHQDGQGHHRNPAHAGLPASALQGLGFMVLGRWLFLGILPPALAEPAHPPVAASLVLAGLPVLAQPSQPAPGAFRHQAQGAGAALHRVRGSRGLGAHQLGDRPGVDPRPQPVLQKVGGHQGQPPTAYLPHHHRHADQSEGRTASAMRTSDGPTGA